MRKHENDPLLPTHGGYRKLKSFQIAQFIYDVTVRFCDRYVGRRSRTHDQMVQAARSGVQNIAEGSQASGTSKKTEIKLTNVARASLEELRLDYEDFLRHHEMPLLPPEHPVLMRFKATKCASLGDLRGWVAAESSADSLGLSSAALVANAALSLLNLVCLLLERQVASQARAFRQEGGFSERLCRERRLARSTS